MSKPGKLIVIDGPDGAGKTTAVGFIEEAFAEMALPFVPVNILSGHRDSLRMRTILVDKQSDLGVTAELLLYAAAINNTLECTVQQLLLNGTNVLIDRGPLSNFAYQVQGIGSENFALWQRLYEGFKADHTLILTCPIEKGLERCAAREGGKDRIESRPLSFHHKMLQSYTQVLDDYQEGFGQFKNITGTLKHYSNNGTLEELRNNCTNFVREAFA